jgi:predicted lipoprotein
MKTIKFLIAMLIASSTMLTMSCSKDDDNNDNPIVNTEDGLFISNDREVDYLVKVAEKLSVDASKLHDIWAESYAAKFIKLDKASSTDFLIDGIVGIAGEVGAEKIAGPFKSKNVLEVESWYSWNSLTDFKNNLRSLENSYKGGYDSDSRGASLETYFESNNKELGDKINKAIDDAIVAIDAIPEPFRSQLNKPESKSKIENAIEKCAKVEDLFAGDVKTAIVKARVDYDFTEIIKVYANKTVVPTYKDMKVNAIEMYEAAKIFKTTKKQADLNKVCEAWRRTRIAWETSESFLFGPADSENLDPALDSWPLDKAQLDGILNSTDAIDKVQLTDVTSGFHTLEYLLFREGSNRTTKF